VQVAVTTTLSGVDPQVGNEDGDTVIVMKSGALEKAWRLTGETSGLQVKESGALPEKPSEVLNLIANGRTLQVTGNEEDADAK